MGSAHRDRVVLEPLLLFFITILIRLGTLSKFMKYDVTNYFVCHF